MVSLGLSVLSCTQDKSEDAVHENTEMKFEAVFEESDITKTILQSNGTSVWWAPGDEISVFYGSTLTGKFRSTNSSPQATAQFAGSLNGTPTGNESYWAIYPYAEDNYYYGNCVYITVPTVQKAIEGSFPENAFPSLAVSNDNHLVFHHICGGARICVSQPGITAIELYPCDYWDANPLAGRIGVKLNKGRPKIDAVDEGHEKGVHFDAPDGGFIPGKYYYVSLLPFDQAKGIEVYFIKPYHYPAGVTLSGKISINRARFGILDNLDENVVFIPQYPPLDLNLFDFSDKIRVTCETTELRTKWEEMSYTALEQSLNTSLGTFIEDYECDPNTYYSDGTHVVKDENGNDIRVNSYHESHEYGTITYNADGFVLELTRDQALAILDDYYGELTLWKCFRQRNHFNGREFVNIGLTVHVDEMARLVDVQEKNRAYWFDDINDRIGVGINGDNKNDRDFMTVRMTHLVPNEWTRGGIKDDVTVYSRNLNNDWNFPNISGFQHYPDFTISPNNFYDGRPGKIKYYYRFSDLSHYIDVFNQWERWTVSNDGSSLSYDGVTVATLSKEGQLTYLNNTKSKYLLNQYALSEFDTDKMLYCKVEIVAYYEEENNGHECVDELGSYVYNVRFLRPVSFDRQSDKYLGDGTLYGSWIPLGSLIGAYDQQMYRLFQPSESTTPSDADYGKYVPCYYIDWSGVKRIEWYGFYGFRQLSIDVNNIEINLYGSGWLPLNEMLEATVYVARSNDLFSPVSSPISIDELDETDPDHPFIKGLSEYVLYYSHRPGIHREYDLRIPFCVSYAWGDCMDWAIVHVIPVE